MEGSYKLHYFELYALGEPVRMALHKAGVQWENSRLSGDSWKAMKESGKLPFGQMPVLEFPDGTMLAQRDAILHYLGDKYNLKPSDPLVNAKCASIALFTFADMFPKVGPPTFSKADDRDKVL